MVAFNFTVFIDKVESGEKTRTIRDKRRCKVGDKLQLYTGMMHKGCRKLRDAVCTNVVKLEIDETRVFLGDFDGVWLDGERADEFAQADGFKDYEHLVSYFKKASPDQEMPLIKFLHEWE